MNSLIKKLYPTGELRKNEFIKLYKELYPHKECNSEFLDMIFDAFDSDKNGLITFSEFLVGISLTGNPNPEKKLRLIFSIYDKNADGKLNSNELNLILNFIKKNSSDEYFQKIRDKLDFILRIKNENFLTQDEFIEFVMNETSLKNFYLNLIKTFEAKSQTDLV
jgi:Ca2+-binding EF-hand superfamily protein